MEVEEGREKIVASGIGGEEREVSSKWKWRRGESRQQQVEVEERWRS